VSTEPLDLTEARAAIAALKTACAQVSPDTTGSGGDWLAASVEVARLAPSLLAEIERLRPGQVWAVTYGNYAPAEVRDLYDNEPAAQDHARILGDLWHVEQWNVLSAPAVSDAQ
jgi:hypothetical protein